MVVALNGRVVGVEQFASPALFAKVRAKLARSYYVDAVDEPVADKGSAPSVEDMKGFMARAASGKETVVAAHRNARTTRKQGTGVVGSEVTEDKAPAKPVYKSVHTDE
jgi:carbamoylphosphate synthase large subunit